ncbi:hypothetical protein BH09ACT6_BH09ACT6_14320 [soil metagenome]
MTGEAMAGHDLLVTASGVVAYLRDSELFPLVAPHASDIMNRED